jgi:hypothetical protein
VEDRWGWLAAAFVTVLGALGTLWGRVYKWRMDGDATAIGHYRQFITEQRNELKKVREDCDRLRTRLTMHDDHMVNQQKLIEQLYVRDARCKADLSYLWEKATKAGLDLGPMPESLKIKADEEFEVRTAMQNTALLKKLDGRDNAPAGGDL